MFVRWIGWRRRLVAALMVALLSVVAARSAVGQPGDPADVVVSPAATADATSDPRAVERFRVAAALQNRELYDLAAAEWSAIRKDYPGDPLADRATLHRGVCLFQLEQFENAATEFRQLVDKRQQLDPKLAEQCFAHLGLAQYNLGRASEGKRVAESLDAAIETFDKQLKQFADGPLAAGSAFYRGEALYARGRLDAALGTYLVTLKQYPQHPKRAELLHALGVAEQEQGRCEQAAASLGRFIAEFPQHDLAADARFRRGDALLELERIDDAETCLEPLAAVEEFADADRVLELQARCRSAAGDFAGAAKLYSQLVSKFPDSRLAAKATIAAGSCSFRAGDFAAAKQWFNRAEPIVDRHAADGSDLASEYVHWLAQALIHDGDGSAALELVAGHLKASGSGVWQVQLELDRADALYAWPERRSESVAAYAAVASKHADESLAPQAAYMAAYAALEGGEIDAASEYATSFLEHYSSHDLAADVCQVAAEVELQQGAYDEAAQAYQKLLAEYPRHADRDAWTVRCAHSLMLAGSWGEAIGVLEPTWQAIDDRAVRAEAALVLGKSYLESGRAEEAVPVLTASAALPRWPQSDDVLVDLAKAQHAAGNRAAAIEVLDRFFGEHSDSSLLDQALLLRGELYVAADDSNAAMADFTRLLAKRPESPLAPRALLLRAAVREDRGDFVGGIADAESFLASDPSRPQRSDALYTRGLCEVGLGKPTIAAKTFSQIVQTDPQYRAIDRVLYDLAWAYQEAGDAAEATATFAKLAESYPESPLAADSYYRWGESQYAADDFSAAAKSFWLAGRRATDPRLLEKSLHKLAWSCFEQQQFEAAEEAFDKQIFVHSSGELAAAAVIMIGECRYQRQEFAKALDSFDRALKQPLGSAALRELTMLHAGQSAAQLKQWNRSLEFLDTCVREFPRGKWSSEVRYERGWALYHLERLDEAQQLFESVAAENTGVLGARAEFMVGEVLFAQKQFDAAVRKFFQVAYGYGDVDAPEPYHHWQAEAMFEAARCLEETKRFDSAQRLYQELLERHPTSVKAAYARHSLEEIKRR